jgi:hypothetical protein
LNLTFELEEAKWNVPVIFDNFVWFSDEELSAAVRQAIPDFDGTAPAAGDMVKAISATLQSLLREKKISGTIEYVSSFERNETAHVFSVKGIALPVCKVSFTGMSVVSEGDLEKKSKALLKMDFSRSFVADFARSNLVPIYRERGHLKAHFADAQARNDDAGCKNGVHVTLAVTEGISYKWNRVEWSGNSVLPSTVLESNLGMRSGELANGLKIDEGLKKISIAYGKKGYIAARLKPTPDFDDASAQVVYRFSITEGPQYHMGTLDFTGISESDANRLRKAWLLKAGDVYNASYLEDFLSVWLTATDSLVARLKNTSVQVDQQQMTVNVTFSFK